MSSRPANLQSSDSMMATAADAARADWSDAHLEALVHIGQKPRTSEVREALRFLRAGLETRRRARAHLRRKLATQAQPSISQEWLRELGIHERALEQREAKLLRALGEAPGGDSCPTALALMAEDLAFAARSYRFVADHIADACL